MLLTPRRATFLFLGLTTALSAPTPAVAQPVDCNLRAFVVHRAGVATLLRSKPNVRSRARAAVPWRRGGVIASVKGWSRGWFRVTAIADVRGRSVLKANGWMHGSRLALRLRSVGGKGIPLHEAPAARAPVDVRLNAAQVRYARAVLLACRGGWARVRIGRVIGWLPPANQCARRDGRCP